MLRSRLSSRAAGPAGRICGRFLTPRLCSPRLDAGGPPEGQGFGITARRCRNSDEGTSRFYLALLAA